MKPDPKTEFTLLAETVRPYFVANVLDGDGEGGRITMDVRSLVDDVVEVVGYWLEDLAAAAALGVES